jgi:DNA-binding NarL/FixJ family response regulator
MEIAWTSSTAEEAYEKLSADLPDLLIVEIQLTGQDGLEFIKNLRPLYPSLKILMHSSLREEFYATRCIRAGAMGFFHKAQPMGELIPAVQRILGGDVFLNTGSMNRAISSLLGRQSSEPSSNGARLTDRELEVITLMASGDSCQDTAIKLRISPRTVQVHRTNIRKKLGLESATRLHAYAVRFFGDSMAVSSAPVPEGKPTEAQAAIHRRRDDAGTGKSSPVLGGKTTRPTRPRRKPPSRR